MRTAPQSIVAQQERYAFGDRFWRYLYVLSSFAYTAFWITILMDPTLDRSLKRLLAFVIVAFFTSVLLLKPAGRAARFRKAADLLGGKIIRYEVGDSVTDAELAEAADQAARIMLVPLPAYRKSKGAFP